MTAKRIAAAVLLLFALAGVVTFTVKAIRSTSGIAPNELSGIKPPARPDATIIHYLYGNVRCVTCNRMGGWTQETVKSAFAAELADGRVEFREENFEAPGHSFFEKDYKIIAASVLLVEFRAGVPVRWINLEKIWELSMSEQEFAAYIRQGVREFLDGKGGQAVGTAESGVTGVADASFLWLIALAIGLGLLTAISPCPLATNVAAISFLGKQVGAPRKVLLAGLLYSLGRTVVYVALGVAILAGLLTTPGLKNFLNTYINGLMGPLLVVVGVLLLELIEVSFGGFVSAEKMQARAERGGLWGALLIGMLFALAFCPTSIALFFGGLIPLAVKSQSWAVLPIVYGVATGVPVILFAVLLAVAAQAVGKWFNALGRVDFWMRRVAGVVFIGVGFFYSLLYIFLPGAS
jgi:cytochrome c biogenesis protein CcdA